MVSTLSAAKRVALYQAMLRIRLVEEKIAALYPEQEMRCPVHLCIGQEAIAVGVCAALEQRDVVFSGHRSHGHYLAKGGDLKRMMAEIYGKATGCSGGRGGSMHLIDLEQGFWGATPIVGSTLPIAVGAAFGAQLKGEERVSVVFFGDGAVEAGIFHESLNFAALKKLPVVFICENNLYSVYSPLSVRQPADRSIAGLAQAHGIHSVAGDGNDVQTVYHLAQAAVSKARSGEGPTLLELSTYRWREHCGPEFDNHIGYRSESEYQDWLTQCPLKRAEAGLNEDWVQMAQCIEAELTEAFAFAKASPYPEAQGMKEYVYAD